MKTQGHSIEVTRSSRTVVIRVNDTVVARSSRPVVLTETGSPVRYYLPAEDVVMDRLEATETTSHCPFKGDAVYWSARTEDAVVEDVAWSYPEPLEAVREIAGLVAFWAEKPEVTLEVGEGTG